MPVIQQETTKIGDVVIWELTGGTVEYARDKVIVAAGQTLQAFSVVGKKTTDGKVYLLDPAATDGTQNAYGILLEAVDSTSGDVESVCLARTAVVIGSKLVFPSGITSAQIEAAFSQLEAKGILVRR